MDGAKIFMEDVKVVARNLAGREELKDKAVKERYQTLNAQLVESGMEPAEIMPDLRKIRYAALHSSPAKFTKKEISPFSHPLANCKPHTTHNEDHLIDYVNSWFPERGESSMHAKITCHDCPVHRECLDFALEHTIKHGVWGGFSERQRQSLRGLIKRSDSEQEVESSIQQMWEKDEGTIDRYIQRRQKKRAG